MTTTQKDKISRQAEARFFELNGWTKVAGRRSSFGYKILRTPTVEVFGLGKYVCTGHVSRATDSYMVTVYNQDGKLLTNICC